MDAVDLIEQHHRHIEELLAMFLDTESGTTQEELLQLVQTALNVHAEMEERVLYPAVEKFVPEQVDEAHRQHAEVKNLLSGLLDPDLNEEDFEARFTALIEDVRQHVQEDESSTGILAVARERLDANALSRMAAAIRFIQGDVPEDLAA